MTKKEIAARMNNGCTIKVCLQPTKKHDKVTLKTWIEDPVSNVCWSVYYNHAKDWLTNEQIRLIELYNNIKNYSFADKVNMNVAYKRDLTNRELTEKVCMLRAINKIEYLELI